jgi:hypothetical protein
MKAKDLAQLILGALVVVGFFGLLVVLAVTTIPTENKDIMLMVVGGLIGSFVTVVGYYFGSSSGSSAKDKIISDMTVNKPQP